MADLVAGREQRAGGENDATDLDRTAMNRALDLARGAAADGEVPVGAVVYITDTGEIIGEGANTRESDRDPAGHAELLAVRRAAAHLGDWRLNHCTVVVTLEPCPMCAGLMVNARVGRLVYGADDPKAGACRSLFAIPTDERLNHRCRIIAGLEAERSADLLREFFKARRRKPRDA